ncbi:MAG: hypothetical protein JSW39_16260 [Desulfobacterales bacterium]|nr:MAG: hypothetical protein JSW39_16260 [Desulfobacterales bacterium]
MKDKNFVGLAASADPTNLVFRGKTHFMILGIAALSIGLTAGKLLGKQWECIIWRLISLHLLYL